MSRKSKINPIEKVKIVERYLRGEIGMRQAGKELGIAYQSIQKWVSSHYHHFKWWFELALIRAGYMLAQKGGYRKHCYWSAIKRYFLNLLFLTLLPALLYISLLPLL